MFWEQRPKLTSFVVLAGFFVLMVVTRTAEEKNRPATRPFLQLPTPAVSGWTTTQKALLSRVNTKRYQKTMEWIAKPRFPGSPHWKKVQQRCASHFRKHGYTVELQKYGTGVNVLGVRKGSRWPEQRFLLSAHYDSVAKCPGADDNATGVAGLLEAATALAGQHKRTMVVACWDEEERGLIGARAYARRAMKRKEDIRGNLVFEMLGYATSMPRTQHMPMGFGLLFPKVESWLKDNRYRGDFLALIGDDKSKPLLKNLEHYGPKVGVKVLSMILPRRLKLSRYTRDLRRSDHAPFWRAGYPGVMMTDTSEFRYRPYHCRHGMKDEAGRLNPEFTARIVKATVLSLHHQLNASSSSP
jgi:hypothetical protein